MFKSHRFNNNNNSYYTKLNYLFQPVFALVLLKEIGFPPKKYPG